MGSTSLQHVTFYLSVTVRLSVTETDWSSMDMVST